MNPEFKYREITFTTKDIEVLEQIMKRNCNVISAALEIAFDQKLFEEVEATQRAVFIVEQCERIASGRTLPEGTHLKQFNFTQKKLKTPERDFTESSFYTLDEKGNAHKWSNFNRNPESP